MINNLRRQTTDFANTLTGLLKAIHPGTWIASTCVCTLLTISILPVSISRSETEIHLCAAVIATAIIGCLALCIRRNRMRFSLIDIIVLGWYAYAMCRVWLDATYPAAGFAIRATLMCLLYVAMRILLTGCTLPGKAIAMLLILSALIEAGMGYSQLISGVSRHHLYPVTGSFLNPGPYSIFLTLGIVTLCALRKTDSLSLSASVFMGIPLALTVSRTAFLSLFVCLLIPYRDRIRGWKQWSLLIVTVLVCGVMLYLVKAGSAEGRWIINNIGIHCLATHILFGNGIGSFFHSFALKTAEISLQNPATDLSAVDVMDYAFDDLLLVGVEQGTIGLAFAVTLIIAVMKRLFTECRPLFLTALSLLTVSLFSYPFELLPYQIIGTVITSYAASEANDGITHENKPSKPMARLIATSILIPLCWIDYVCIHEISLRLYAEKSYELLAGIRDNAFTKDYYEFLPLLDDNKRFLFDFALLLSDQGRYNDSNEMLRRGALISNDPMFIVLQGNNYRDMKAYELAEEAYLQAWHTMPNRIYPLYRVMKLHEQRADTVEAKAIAQKVIAFKEKIKSPAVNDMKREAKEIYRYEK